MKEYLVVVGTLLVGIYIGRLQSDRELLKLYNLLIDELVRDRKKKSDRIFTNYNSYNKKGCE